MHIQLIQKLVTSDTIELHVCLTEPTTQALIKIDSYYERQKIAQGFVVSSNLGFVYIRGCSWEKGHKMTLGFEKTELFSSVSHYNFN